MAADKNGVAALGSGIGGSSELRSRLFVLLAMVIFRIGSHITIPGVDPRVMAELFQLQSDGILGMLNMFGGGALSRMSLFALGVMPYISASIIMQLMTHVIPSLEQLRKEGESGRRVITRYTRYGTLLLATIQSVGIAVALQGQGTGGQSVVFLTGPGFVLTAAITLITGTMFLMWLGEQITERGIGNGISFCFRPPWATSPRVTETHYSTPLSRPCSRGNRSISCCTRRPSFSSAFSIPRWY